MKPAIMNVETTTVTRRTVLGGLLASTVASMVPSTVFAEVVDFAADGRAHGPNSNKASLYAFPGVQPETTVIAATWPVHLNRFDSSAQKESQVTIHCGSPEVGRRATWLGGCCVVGTARMPNLCGQRRDTAWIRRCRSQAVIIEMPKEGAGRLRSAGYMG